ncbi:alpha-ketoacid dehydrogenase subunit alpha/beta [Terricaulis silvestris]|uniref:2-oxoglutarate dehydrogenase E1 component n=1 Tax=Terricaulis silvestris TaxID=2686094 RepID=A0A6I6MHG9_9CAUL|nr:thiamine pyrophosphate-dependent enzyme [Terricaulis silvestris]QGZ93849.1 2-oxoisovalerate dehydrogenase subunit beta [Terricaulis silvestris]
MSSKPKPAPKTQVDTDWKRVVELVQCSRAMDAIEEQHLVPGKKIFYQFSARGHDMAQVLLGLHLTHLKDAICGYYRSRPILLSLGVKLEDALGSAMGRAGGYSDGRDIGVVFNYPNASGASALPMCGGVGAQYTPTAGYAQAIEYCKSVLGDHSYDGAMGVVLGGDASVATNGFWSALTMATTLKLPMLFYIEDNGFGISTPGWLQTPGENIAKNLASFSGLKVLDGDGTDPVAAAELISEAVGHVRAGLGPTLLRLAVPRLQGHSFQDTQAYKSKETVDAEWARDPLPKLKAHVVPSLIDAKEWDALEANAKELVERAAKIADQRPVSEPSQVTRFVFSEDGALQDEGGLWNTGYDAPRSSDDAKPEGARINMITAIRRTLDHELAVNPRVLVFGEDVGPKGGVHGVTLGLQEKYGVERVFDTSLSEEGIIGRAVGMAIAGLMPVPEIQFRKYADPACEQINDCGTMRWRTANRFAAPMVVRMPVGFFKCGDPWHSQTNEVQFVHSPGWRVVCPSNAEDAVGLLRTALRGNDPVMFLEHRNMLDAASARRPYPGDDFALPFGVAKRVREGGDITVVAWGAMVERCEAAADKAEVSADIIDLRTLAPWDSEAVLASVRRTHRCFIVHEDIGTGGFGAEIAAVVADQAFLDLDAPVVRMTMPDIPSPHHPKLMEWALPSAERIAAKITELVGF